MRDAHAETLLQKRGDQRKRKICSQCFSFLRPGPSITQFVAQKTHSYLAGSVVRISQGTAVFCVRNASISRFVRSMPSPSTSPALLHCDVLSTALLHHDFYKCGSSRRRRSGASARNGDANVSHSLLSKRVVGGIRRAGADDL